MKPVLQVFAFDVTSKVLLALAGLALIRYLPKSEYAILTLIFPFVAGIVQGVTANLNGVYLVGYKRLNLDENPQMFLALELWLLGGVILFTAPFASFFSNTFAIVVVLILGTGLLEFVKTFYQHQLKFISFSLLESARAALYLGALVCLVWITDGRFQAWHVLSLQAVCVLAVALIAFGKRLDPTVLFRFREIFSIAKSIFRSRFLFMFGYFFILAFVVRVDVVMLKVLEMSDVDAELQLATYGSALRYYGLVMVLLAAMHTVFLPLTQRVTNRKDLSSLLVKHQRMIFVIVPVVLLGAWLSRWIIPLIDLGKYPDAYVVFRILAISSIVSLAFSPHANILFRYDAYRYMFFVVCGAFIVNVGLNAILIPRFHASGAAWATLVAMGIVNGLTYAKSRSLIISSPLPDNSSAVATAG